MAQVFQRPAILVATLLKFHSLPVFGFWAIAPTRAVSNLKAKLFNTWAYTTAASDELAPQQ